MLSKLLASRLSSVENVGKSVRVLRKSHNLAFLGQNMGVFTKVKLKYHLLYVGRVGL